MGFADEGLSGYPIVHCDLADILGAPGMPAPAELARSLSTPRHRWSSVAGGDSLFLATSTAGAGAFAPLEQQLAQPVGSERVQHTFRSGVCSQQTHQQTLRDKAVVGARFRTVSSPHGSVVLGGPVADLSRRDPGPAPRHSVAAVTRAVRDQLKVTDSAKIDVERVIFPRGGRGVWAYRVKVTDRSAALDVRAYVEGDKELSLLYAQDVSCAASFGGGSCVPGESGTPSGSGSRTARRHGGTARCVDHLEAEVSAGGGEGPPTPSTTSGWNQMPVASRRWQRARGGAAMRRPGSAADGRADARGKGSASVDGGTTTIEISAKKAARIVLAAGDDAPEPIWALLDSVESLCRDEDDEGASSGGRGKREG